MSTCIGTQTPPVCERSFLGDHHLYETVGGNPGLDGESVFCYIEKVPLQAHPKFLFKVATESSLS